MWFRMHDLLRHYVLHGAPHQLVVVRNQPCGCEHEGAEKIELADQPHHPSTFQHWKCVEIVLPKQVLELAEVCSTAHRLDLSRHVLAHRQLKEAIHSAGRVFGRHPVRSQRCSTESQGLAPAALPAIDLAQSRFGAQRRMPLDLAQGESLPRNSMCGP